MVVHEAMYLLKLLVGHMRRTTVVNLDHRRAENASMVLPGTVGALCCVFCTPRCLLLFEARITIIQRRGWCCLPLVAGRLAVVWYVRGAKLSDSAPKLDTLVSICLQRKLG